MVEIWIKVKNGCLILEELFVGILSDFICKLDYVYFFSILGDFYIFFLLYVIIICWRIMDGIEKFEKYKNFVIILFEIKSVLKKYIFFYSSDVEKLFKIIV